MNTYERVERFSQKIGYRFKKTDLLRWALTYGCERHHTLALFGDALWTEYLLYALCSRDASLEVKSLHLLKTALINNNFLGERAKTFGILDYVISTNPSKLYNSQLASVFEAVIGAVRLDSRDYDEACRVAFSIMQLDKLFTFPMKPVFLITQQDFKTQFAEEAEQVLEVTVVDVENSELTCCEDVTTDDEFPDLVEESVQPLESSVQLPKITFIEHGKPLPENFRAPVKQPESRHEEVVPASFLSFSNVILPLNGSNGCSNKNGHRRSRSRKRNGPVIIMTTAECEAMNAETNPEFRLRRLVRDKFGFEIDVQKTENKQQVIFRVVAKGKNKVFGTGSGKKPGPARAAAIENALKNLAEG